MTTSEALLSAVLANPADDLPRLVYADYLEENGERERAEFIRVQCEIADIDRKRMVKERIPGGSVAVRAVAARRERELRPKGDRLYWGTGPYDYITGFEFRRGFVAEVTCTLSQWCGGGNRTCTRCNYVAEHPWEDRCPSCNSHRLLQYPQGIGPAVVRSHPVEVVRVTGVRHTGGRISTLSGAVRWWRVTRETVGPLWEFLDTIRTDYRNFDYVDFASEEYADAKISAAAISWAKSQPHPARITSSPVSVDVTT
jgi:uncharacterized protein (TIGR02996 family)